MKYLFYADFTFHRDFERIISNCRYVRLPHGPCPDGWFGYLDELKRKKFIKIEEKRLVKPDGTIGIGEYYNLQNGTFNDELFTSQEIKRMKEVYETLSEYNTTELLEMSHNEVAYIEAEDKSEIDLKYSCYLDLLKESNDEDEDIPGEVAKAVSELETAGII